MRAAAFGPDSRLAVVDKRDPSPGPEQVVVAVECCGVCGSDLHLVGDRLLPPGAVPGHEFGGVVVAVGPGVSHPTVGQRVAVLPSRRCGSCDPCRAGRDNLCFQQITTAIGLGLNDGGFAELALVPAGSCFPMPGGTTAAQLALAEPYAVAIHAVARSRIAADPGLAAGVLGAGSVGLLCVAALRAAGVEAIAVAEPNEARAAAAAAMGAVVVAKPGDMAATLGRAPDVVFEAAGVAATPGAAVEVAAIGGQVVLLGTAVPGAEVPMPLLLWLVKEVDVVPSIAYTTNEFAAAVDAVAGGVADEVAARSRPAALTEAQTAIDDLRAGAAVVKVLLYPNGPNDHAP